jgi:pimeloyl-ACP methyl ester carboxylesterase
MSRHSVLAIAFCLLIGSQAGAQLSLHDCLISGELVRCGTLQVPENRKTPAGRPLALTILVGPHSDRGESREPLFILKGGPGERATVDAEDTLQMFRGVRRNHDLVLLDQRGTGGVNRLQCDVADHTFLVPRDPERCQLVKMRLTIYLSNAVNNLPTVGAVTADRNRTALTRLGALCVVCAEVSLPRWLTRRRWREPHDFCPAVHAALQRSGPKRERPSRAAASWHQSLSFDTVRGQPIHNQGRPS